MPHGHCSTEGKANAEVAGEKRREDGVVGLRGGSAETEGNILKTAPPPKNGSEIWDGKADTS